MSDTLTVQEIREWLDNHERTPPIACLLCDETVPVDKDTVVRHLVDNHKPESLAILIALWWFMEDEDEVGEQAS